MLALMHWWYTAERGFCLPFCLLLACRSDAGDPTPGTASEASAYTPSEVRRCGEGVVAVGTQAIWGRDPASGSCSAYTARCEIPPAWPTFESEEECQTSCRCQRYAYPKGVDPRSLEGLWQRTEVVSLDCECSIFSCGRDEDQLATAGAALCGEYGKPTVIRKQGCGQVAFDFENGTSGGGAVFDAESGALIGRSSGGDVAGEPCGTFARTAGQDFICGSAEICLLCGEWGRTSPAPPPCE